MKLGIQIIDSIEPKKLKLFEISDEKSLIWFWSIFLKKYRRLYGCYHRELS